MSKLLYFFRADTCPPWLNIFTIALGVIGVCMVLCSVFVTKAITIVDLCGLLFFGFTIAANSTYFFKKIKNKQ